MRSVPIGDDGMPDMTEEYQAAQDLLREVEAEMRAETSGEYAEYGRARGVTLPEAQRPYRVILPGGKVLDSYVSFELADGPLDSVTFSATMEDRDGDWYDVVFRFPLDYYIAKAPYDLSWNRHIVSVSDPRGRSMKVPKAPSDAYRRLAMSRERPMKTSANGRWEIWAGEILTPDPSHPGAVVGTVIVTDGNRLITCSIDGDRNTDVDEKLGGASKDVRERTTYMLWAQYRHALERASEPYGKARQRNSERTKRARSMDSRRRARQTFPADFTDEQYAMWASDPGRYDIVGIDTPTASGSRKSNASAKTGFLSRFRRVRT